MEVRNIFDGEACGWVEYLGFASKTSKGCDFMMQAEPWQPPSLGHICGIHISITNGASKCRDANKMCRSASIVCIGNLPSKVNKNCHAPSLTGNITEVIISNQTQKSGETFMTIPLTQSN